jgi:hypothetical protein
MVPVPVAGVEIYEMTLLGQEAAEVVDVLLHAAEEGGIMRVG